jgi:hypothetical protein
MVLDVMPVSIRPVRTTSISTNELPVSLKTMLCHFALRFLEVRVHDVTED